MALNWKPHTALVPPTSEPPLDILVGLPADAESPAIVLGVFTVWPDGKIESLECGDAPDTPWFWVSEEEVREGLPCID